MCVGESVDELGTDFNLISYAEQKGEFFGVGGVEMAAIYRRFGIGVIGDNLKIAAESDGLFGGAVACHAGGDSFSIEYTTFILDFQCGQGGWHAHAFENAVLFEECGAVPQSESLAFGLDGDAEVERHDHHLVAGLKGAELEVTIEVHDAVERGLMLGGDAEVGFPACYFVGYKVWIVVEGEKVIHVHLAEDLLGARNGIGRRVVVDEEKQLFPGFGDFSGGEELGGFLKGLVAGLDVDHLGGGEKFFVVVVVILHDERLGLRHPFAEKFLSRGGDFFAQNMHGEVDR